MKRKKQNIILLKLGFAENENVIFRKQWGILNESSWCQGLNVLYSKVMRESDKEKSYGLVIEYHIFFFLFNFIQSISPKLYEHIFCLYPFTKKYNHNRIKRLLTNL